MKFLRVVAILPLLLSMLVATSLLSSGCSTAETRDSSTPEGAYQIAEDLAKDERYEEAIAKFGDIKNKFPYSRYATMSELKIADLHFQREAYVEAQSAYQLFKEFHPKHPQSDYVTYRLAMSYYNQLPTTIDRDLTLADKAVLYFDEVVNSFPESQYVKESKEKRESALKMQAQKEMYVADFYAKRSSYDSALKRYETVLKSYPNLGYDAPALLGAARSAFETGERDRALQHMRNLQSLYPSSDEAKRAKNEFEKYGAN